MPIPNNFSSWEHFQNIAVKTHNKKVREFFNQDLEDQDITSPEGAVRRACLLEDNDTAAQTIAKMLFFAVDCGWLESLLESIFYGIPKIELQQNYRYVNQIVLLFSETYQDMKKARRTHPKRLRVSFRWLQEPNAENVTQTEVNSLINRINQHFPESYSHYCGVNFYIHYNPKVYDKHFKIPARNESEAIRFYEKLFRIMQLDLDQRKLRKVEREIKATKEYLRILGETYPIEDDLPLANVKLKQAILHLHGKTTKEILIDRKF